MCEVVNSIYQQQQQQQQPSQPQSSPPPSSPETPPLSSVAHQVIQQSPSPQQVPFMLVMATGNYGNSTISCNGQLCSQAFTTQSPINVTTTTMSLSNGTQTSMHHTLITGHPHTMKYTTHCATPPPQMIQQPTTATIYTVHTIGASTNFIQLQSSNAPQVSQSQASQISVPPQSQQQSQQLQSQQQQQNAVSSSTITGQDAIDYYVPSAPIPIPATPTYHIEVPAHTLSIELGPFKSATELCAEPGDIIEIDRTLFSHWAIYVGSGEVVHIVGSQTQEVPDNERAIVQKLPLIQVAGDCFCRVNNKTLRARERNFLPFHNEIVVRKALSKVDTTVPYNALKCNSEHYVTEWKYGHRWSDQAQFNLNSFKALRRPHTNSVTESHQLFVNTLNQVLNSPANSGSCLAGLNSAPAVMPTVPSSSLSLSTSPPRRARQMSVSEQSTTSSPTPPSTSGSLKSGNAFQARLTRALSASTFSTGVQTELSLL